MRKRVFNYLITVAILAWVLAMMVLVMQCGTRVFHSFLIKNQSLLEIQKIILPLLKRMILTTMLSMGGVGCVFFYFISYESSDFLICSRIMLLAAGLVCTNRDMLTLFYSERGAMLIWLKSQDAFLLLFSTVAIDLLYSHFFGGRGSRMHYVNIAAGFAFALVAVTLKPVDALFVLLCYCGYVLALLLYMLLRFFRASKRRAGSVWTLAFIVPIVFFTAFLGRCKYSVVPWQNQMITQEFPNMVSVYALLLMVLIYRRQRVGLLLGNSQNRKFQDYLQNKESLAMTLTRYCAEPVQKLNFLTRTAVRQSKKESEQWVLLHKMQNELIMLERHMDNIMEYESLPRTTAQKSKIKMNLRTIVDYSRMSAQRLGTQWDFAMPAAQIGGSREPYILGDPYGLVRANQSILMALAEFRRGDRLLVRWERDGAYYLLEMAVALDPAKRRRAMEFRRIFTKKIHVPYITDEEIITLGVAHRIIANHGSLPSVSITGDGMVRVSYYLPAWTNGDEERELKSADEAARPFSRDMPVVLLVSTSSEQIELIRSYLEYEAYKLKIFTDEQSVLKYLGENDDASMVIIGTIFLHMTIEQLCGHIRDKYTLDRMPILLIRQERFIDANDIATNYINDILIEPFQQFALLQKVKCLVMLKRAVDETIRARLDFLQSQMDPHFIFNTIGTIMPLCISDSAKAYELLGYFSDYLRASLFSRDLQEAVSIQQEMDLIEAYLEIEKVRFGNRIECAISRRYPQDLRILPLLIEPIVENCVKHGIRQEGILRIQIEIMAENGWLFVSVRDNGKGMTAARMAEVLSEEKQARRKRSIGLANVRQRLKIYYHTNLSIRSTPSEGTTVSFSIREPVPPQPYAG